MEIYLKVLFIYLELKMHKKYINDELVTMSDSEYSQFETERNILREEMKNFEQQQIDRENKKASAKQKLQDLGLTVDEIKEAFGI